MKPGAVIFGVLLFLATNASALDRPIDANKLVLKQTSAGVKVVFVSRDANFLFPLIGSADDPVSGSPGGALVEIFSASEGTYSVAATTGDPGWSLRDGSVHVYRFRNRGASGAHVRTLLAKDGRVLKVRGANLALALSGAHGSVGIRVSFGATRNCALFVDTSVAKDRAGIFVGKGAVASALADCSDDELLQQSCGSGNAPTCGGTCPAGESCTDQGGVCTCTPDACGDQAFPSCDGTCPVGSVCSSQDLLGCTCISDTAPCGSTFPTCNGECPAGEECANIGGVPLNNCGCIPIGQTPCGTNQCGGVCPIGQECNYFESGEPPSLFAGCLCGPPGPCGSGGDDCPPGFFCGLDRINGSFTCFPRLCNGGTYPTCGGSCSGGDVCMPFGVSEFTGCICSPPGGACDASCGTGFECPAGEACVSADGGSCACEPF